MLPEFRFVERIPIVIDSTRRGLVMLENIQVSCFVDQLQPGFPLQLIPAGIVTHIVDTL